MNVKAAYEYVDWCMLAATISEKAYGMKWGGTSNPTKEMLFEKLETNLPQEIWNQLKIKLV